MNFGDGLGFAVTSNMATFAVLCKAPIALSSRQAGRALLRNAPVAKPVRLVALPKSRKSAAESSIARGRLVSQFRGEGLKRISPQLNGRKPWLQKSARTMHGVAVAFTGNDSSLANDIPSIDTLKASQLKKVDQIFHFCKVHMEYVAKRIFIIFIAYKHSPYSSIMLFGIDDIRKFSVTLMKSPILNTCDVNLSFQNR